MPNIILDGEFYNHNMNLQEISGIVRHQDINLDMSIYYGFFNLPPNDISFNLYNSIKDYKICFIYFVLI